MYFSEWDYFRGVVPTGWTAGNCYLISYLLYQTNYDDFLTGSLFTYTYKNMKGVTCFLDTAASSSAFELTLATGYLPVRWGLNLPGYGGYSQNSGNLIDLHTNYLPVPNLLTIADITTVLTPTMGPSMVKSVGRWVVPLPVDITYTVEVVIDGGANNLAFTSPAGECSVAIG